MWDMEMMGSRHSDLSIRPPGDFRKNVPPMYRDGPMDPMDFAMACDVPSSNDSSNDSSNAMEIHGTSKHCHVESCWIAKRCKVNHLCMGHGFHGYVSLLEDIWWTTCPQTQGAVAVAMIDTSWRLARLKFILRSREHAESACVTQFLKLAGVSYPFWRLPKGQVITIIIGLLLCLLWTQLPKCVAMQAIGNTTIRIQYHKWPQHAERPFRTWVPSVHQSAGRTQCHATADMLVCQKSGPQVLPLPTGQ